MSTPPMRVVESRCQRFVKGSWPNPWRSPSLLCVLISIACGVATPIFGQTPWVAAPAKPAPLPELPAAQNSVQSDQGTKTNPTQSPKQAASDAGTVKKQEVVPLPTPPPRRGGPGQSSGLALPNLPPLPATQSDKDTSGNGSLTTDLPSFPGVPSRANSALAPAGPTTKSTVPKSNVDLPSGRPGITTQPMVGLPQLRGRPQVELIGTASTVGKAEQVRELDSGSLIAVVGSDHILAGDMAQYVEPIVEQNRSRINSAAQEKSLREQIIREVLKHYIEMKAMYQEFFRDAAGAATPDKLEDMKKEVLTKAGKIFFEKQVPVMMEKYEAQNLQELERKLREKSMSLSVMKATFVEQVLAQELERKYVPDEYEITRDELLAYYQEHESEWSVPQRAKWKQLTVRFDKHDNDRAAVERLIKQLGNQIYLGGQSFEAVAKQSSEDFHASEGGHYDWTRKGSLKSKPLENAIFSIPPGRLSQVITDDVGMHIVVVLERTEAETKSFAEAQAEIREKLSFEKRVEEAKKFRAKVVARTPVWSRWSDYLQKDIKHIRPLEEAVDLSTEN